MLVVALSLVVLICVIFAIFKIVKSENTKFKKALLIFITIVILAVVCLLGVILYKNLPHNEVSKGDREALETYISNKYGLDLRVTESKIFDRGNIGINPGVEYKFVLKNSMGFEYQLSINRIIHMDIKTILSENPEFNLVQIK